MSFDPATSNHFIPSGAYTVAVSNGGFRGNPDFVTMQTTQAPISPYSPFSGYAGQGGYFEGAQTAPALRWVVLFPL